LGDSEPAFHSVAVVGVGLIGGSIALGVRERWPSVRVYGVDRPAVLTHASSAGAIDTGFAAVADLPAVDLVVLAAPVRQNTRVLTEVPPHLREQALITDVGGTKRDAVKAAGLAGTPLRFVGGHPLGGAEHGGFGVGDGRVAQLVHVQRVRKCAGRRDHRLQRQRLVRAHVALCAHHRVHAGNACLPHLGVLADNEGYFATLPDGNGYVEIISYDKLVRDAKRRNRVLFVLSGRSPRRVGTFAARSSTLVPHTWLVRFSSRFTAGIRLCRQRLARGLDDTFFLSHNLYYVNYGRHNTLRGCGILIPAIPCAFVLSSPSPHCSP